MPTKRITLYVKQNIQSILTVGTTGIIVEIECQLSNGLPSIVIVGLGSKAVDEAKERLRSAFASSNLAMPRKRITINLAPADIPKESTSFDLAIGAAMLLSSGQTQPLFGKRHAIIGEVGLDGNVRPVRGIIGKLTAGKVLGIERFFIPTGNLAQALLVPDIEIVAIQSIKDLYMGSGQDPSWTVQKSTPNIAYKTEEQKYTFSQIAGQTRAKRALVIAAAGGHNILLTGPPGTGKSMLARTLPYLLPPLSHQEVLEVTHLHSLSGTQYEKLITTRPFRTPHHSSSHISIVGGGTRSSPGEITLSHRGVLFLDEMPEFNRPTLEALRQPLEDRVVTISRAKQTIEYPAHFILIATANPCPCGYYGTAKQCQCMPHQIARYQQKISGPILDRIDLHVTVDFVDHSKLLAVSTAASDDSVQKRIQKAHTLQSKRYVLSGKRNADMNNEELKKLAHIEKTAVSLLNQAAAQLNISARSYMKLIKIARTIADLEQSETITVAHISEALQYRPTPHKP